jgi:hypothetical protein
MIPIGALMDACGSGSSVTQGPVLAGSALAVADNGGTLSAGRGIGGGHDMSITGTSPVESRGGP